MRSTTLQAAVGSALLLLAAAPLTTASSAHRHAHNHYASRRAHGHSHFHETEETMVAEGALVTRGGKCVFPFGADGVQAVTPGSANAGWAMSPDQTCTPGNYCPIACKPGMVTAQWQPGSTYTYPASMNGGLFCNADGDIVKPFPDSPYCVAGTGAVSAVNTCGKNVAWCQTVLPGNEAMLIKTDVTGTSKLAVPGPSYWAGTAAHFYVNEPGHSGDDACLWGDTSAPIGNWAPYVAGANTVASGMTFVKIAWNPKYMDDFSHRTPSYGVKIECPNGQCNGLPCSINPKTASVGSVTSADAAVGDSNAGFCVVTVTSGTANIVTFNTDGTSGSVASVVSSAAAVASVVTPNVAVKVAATTPATSAAAATTTTPSSSSSISSSSTASSVSTALSSSSLSTTSQSTTSSTTSTQSVASAAPSAVFQGIFHENGTTTPTYTYNSPTAAAAMTASLSSAIAASTSTNDAVSTENGGAAVVGLIVAFVATTFLI